MEKLQPMLNTVRQIQRLIDSLPSWTVADVPRVRGAVRPLPKGACTEPGYTALKKALRIKTAALDAESLTLEQALHNYSKKVNDVCNAKFDAYEYRAELRATQALRKEEKAERIEVQAELHQHKLDHTRGFAQRDAQKQKLKRKRLGTDETKEKTVFDL